MLIAVYTRGALLLIKLFICILGLKKHLTISLETLKATVIG